MSPTRLYGLIAVSIIVILLFGGTLWIVLTHELPTGQQTLANLMLGGLTVEFGHIVNAWTGSSVSSGEKDATIDKMSDALAVSTPPAPVPASGGGA